MLRSARCLNCLSWVQVGAEAETVYCDAGCANALLVRNAKSMGFDSVESMHKWSGSGTHKGHHKSKREKNPDPEKWLTLRQISEKLGIHEKRVRKLTEDLDMELREFKVDGSTKPVIHVNFKLLCINMKASPSSEDG